MNLYIPEFITKNYQNKIFKGNFKAISVFCDISGFTALTEKLLKHEKDGSEILTETLFFAFNPMVKAIYSHSGFISHFLGDAFIAFFPVKNNEIHKSANSAFSAIKEILYFFETNGNINTEYGNFSLSVKIGIAYGDIDWGIVGDKNKGYYFSGDAINRAVNKADNTLFGISDELLKYKNYKREKPGKIRSSKIPKNIFKKFLPEEFLTWNLGEFRQIVNIFISFDCESDYETINKVFSYTQGKVNLYGGFLSRLSFGDKGKMLLIFFGFPKSYEDNLKRAFSFIEDFRDNINKCGLEMKFRAGITSGLVYSGISGGERRAELTCHGDIVNFAARLTFSGDYNNIFCSEEIIKKTEKFTETKFLYNKKFKGKKNQHPVYQFLNIKKKIDIESKNIPIIGREKEFKIVTSYLESSIFNTKFGGLYYIYGTAGIGKSTFINKLNKNLQKEHAFNWVYLPSDGMVSKPFEGLKYFIRNYFNFKEDNIKQSKINFLNKIKEIYNNTKINKNIRNEIWRLRSVLASELQIYWANSLYSKLTSKLKLENLLQSYRQLILALSEIKPTILIFEDAHWLDKSTENLLLSLTREVNNYSFILIFICRDNEDLKKKVKFKIFEKCISNELYLHPLKDSEKEFVNSIFGKGEIGENIKKLLIEKAAGNPFYIEQWLYYLKSKNLVKKTLNIWELKQKEYDIPSNIDQLIISRIDSFGYRIKKTIQYASVLGYRFFFKHLSQMLKKDINFTKNIKTITNSSIILPERKRKEFDELVYCFKHLIYRDVAYYMQLKQQRVRIHKQVLNLIEKLFKNNLIKYYDQLCFHAEFALMTDKLKFYLSKTAKYYKEKFIIHKAITYFNKLLTLNIDKKEKIEILIELSELYNIIGPLSKSMECIEKAKDIKIHNKYIEANINYQYSLICYLLSDNKTALKYINESLAIYKKKKDRSKIAICYRQLGNINMRINEIDIGFNYFKKSLVIFEKLDDKRGIKSVSFNMSSMYLMINNLKKAEFYLNYYSKIPDSNSFDKAQFLQLLSILSIKKGDLKEALRLNKRSVKFYKKIGYQHHIANILFNIGVSYHLQNKYKKALIYYLECLKIFKEIGMVKSESIVSLLHNIADAYSEIGNHNTAIDHYLQAIELEKNLSLDNYFMSLHHALGKLYIEVGKIKKSKKIFMKLNNFLKKIKIDKNNHRHKAIYYSTLAEIEIFNKNINQSFKYFNKSIEFYRLYSDTSGEKEYLANILFEYALRLIKHKQNKTLIKELISESSSIYKNLGNKKKEKFIKKHLQFVQK